MANHSYPEILLTCEHAGNKIPQEFKDLFAGAEDILNSHRGWDPGAIKLTEALSELSRLPLISYPFSRLLIEPNRSEHHPKLFSEFTKSLSKDAKSDLLNNYYRPHRKRISDEIYGLISQNMRVLHIGVHTFTPELNGKLREFDIGILYDPSRIQEKVFAKKWGKNLQKRFRVRMNQPYKGKADGLITSLRKLFSDEVYMGVELEVNQKPYLESPIKWKEIGKALSDSLRGTGYIP